MNKRKLTALNSGGGFVIPKMGEKMDNFAIILQDIKETLNKTMYSESKLMSC